MLLSSPKVLLLARRVADRLTWPFRSLAILVHSIFFPRSSPANRFIMLLNDDDEEEDKKNKKEKEREKKNTRKK